MRDIPSELAVTIEGGAALLCHVWIVERRDGVRLGFTDHDRALTVEGVVCSAASGWTGGAAEGRLGLEPGTASAAGVLDDAAVTAADLDDGLWDGAAVELWRVDWSAPARRVRLSRGTIARVAREGDRFVAEAEGALTRLDRVAGRSFGRTCDAALGDDRCRAAVDGAGFNGSGTVVAADGPRLTVGGLGAFADGWFSGGRLSWTSGANAGRVSGVALHRGGLVVLDEAARRAVAAGDGFTVRAGCDKRAATCREKFGNGLNFQGFPEIPGDDFLTAYPVEGGRHDGASRRG